MNTHYTYFRKHPLTGEKKDITAEIMLLLQSSEEAKKQLEKMYAIQNYLICTICSNEAKVVLTDNGYALEVGDITKDKSISTERVRFPEAKTQYEAVLNAIEFVIDEDVKDD